MKERIFEQVTPARRDFLKKLLAGAAFAAPVIATFSVEALMPAPAYGAANIFCPAPPVLATPPAPPTAPVCPPFSCAPPPVPVPATTPVILACPPTNNISG